MGITKATFRCDNCGKKKNIHFPTSDGRNRPRGWVLTVFGCFAVYACSKQCAMEWDSAHSVGRTPADNSSKDEQDDILELIKTLFPPGGKRPRIRQVNLSEFFGDSYKDLNAKLAEEFEVPKEIIVEFFDHVVKTVCPKCKAEPEERCHLTPDDDSYACPEHGPELKPTVHPERVAAAKISWKEKLQ